ncbi:MAG: FkbM family methyltransferase [Phycisphaerales bacterium JB040]
MRDQLRLLARAIKYRYKLDPAEVRFVLRTLRPGMCAIDLGAHKGAYTYWLRRAVGRSGRVVAVEAQQRLAERLDRLMRGSANVDVVWAAISDRTGTGRLSTRADGSSHGASITGFGDEPDAPTSEVPTTTLGDLLASRGLDRLDFIKCDVEGHEVAVFEASVETLAQHRPTILVECEERHGGGDGRDGGDGGDGGGVEPGNVTRLAGVVEPLGYRMRFFCAGTLRPRSEFDPATHQRYGHGEYCNNWVLDVPG